MSDVDWIDDEPLWRWSAIQTGARLPIIGALWIVFSGLPARVRVGHLA